jgi:dephospho-CoA kinase
MLIVGLTGGIGSGKSAAAKIFSHFGIEVIDTDSLARQVVLPGSDALKKIVKHFGDQVLDLDDNLDRVELGRIVFNNAAERTWLEQLLHPVIDQYARDELAAANSEYAVLMSPLLLESGQRKLVDRVLVVDCSQDQQEQRVMKRSNLSLERVRKIIAAQMSHEERLMQADDIITNNTDLAALLREVTKLHEGYLEL